MNDFTKEELDELRSSRCYHLDDNFPYEDTLFMKLESMIENYCEPIKRDYCPECLSDAINLFESPLPSLDIIYSYAEDFHKNMRHRNEE